MNAKNRRQELGTSWSSAARTHYFLIPLSLLFLSGCSWFTDFKQQPKIDPWETASDTIPFRGNPQNSVPVYGTAAPGYEYARTALPATIESMANIPNPVPADARSLDNGRKNFQINCEPCHGPGGLGDGPVTKFGMPGMNIGSPTSLAATKYTDGYIFGMIRNGRGLMPTYNRIEESDRWDIINYLRALQGKGGVRVAAAPVGRPGETGPEIPGVSTSAPTRPAPYYKQVASQAMVPLGPDNRSPAAGAAPDAAPGGAANAPAASDSTTARAGRADTTRPGAAPRRPDTTRPASRVPRPSKNP